MIEIKNLSSLHEEERKTILRRSLVDLEPLLEHVGKIVRDVKARGDLAILEMSREFKEDVSIEDLLVTEEEIEEAFRSVDPDFIAALNRAKENIQAFHKSQKEKEFWATQIGDGIILGRISRPIEKVGCYIPGGRAPYPSTVLMTVIPARVAGVKEVYLVTPAGPGLVVDPSILVSAKVAGVNKIFKIGGPWGIAALAYGTGIVPKVYKIVGPGNKYVTAAKLLVYGIVDIDSPAGPSEGMILADETANPFFVALDLISQLEHDPDAASILVSTSHELCQKVVEIIPSLVDKQPRKEIIREAMGSNLHIVFCEGISEAVEFVNQYAPEHLEIQTKEPFSVLSSIRYAGSIFLGDYSPIAAGDYASGTNHVLPTAGTARMFSGLSVDDFIVKPTFQYLSREGLYSISKAILDLARKEGLFAHGHAVEARLETKGA